jgi:RNA polymerase sigma-70 factor, ECF subfamily
MTDGDPFLEHRSLLFAIAYRMLGSVADAEDAVQETYLRWSRTAKHGEEIRSPKAWLTTTLSRVCLDQLGSARVKREQYIGPWLPEPLAGVTPDVAETVADFDSLSLAFLVLLESLSPKERAVFLLHDVFGYDFASIGEIVGESDAYCRQLAKRARAHMAERRPRYTADRAQQERLTADFLRAVSEGDMPSLIETLTDDVTVFSDGGGKVNAARKPVVGRGKVAKFLTNIVRLAPAGTSFRIEPINGQPGIVTLIDGAVQNVVTFEFADSAIRAVYVVVNPDKLATVASAMSSSEPTEDQTE